MSIILAPILRQYRALSRGEQRFARIGAGLLASLIIITVVIEVVQPHIVADRYNLARYEGSLLPKPVLNYAQKITYDPSTQAYAYNRDYSPTQSDVAGQIGGPKITASFSGVTKNSVTVNDPVNRVGMTVTPLFGLDEPKQNINRIVYPLKGYNGTNVYTLRASGIKEDIILNSYSGDRLNLEYELNLPDGLEAKLEDNGSLAVYGVRATLLGNVSTGTDSDAELLQQARQNGAKTTLLFTVPAPVVLEGKSKVSASAGAWFELRSNRLVIHVTGLKNANYPLSIDPSIYVETAAKLMRGNNETNTDFDVGDELIQKSQTTGARIDSWENNLDMNEGIWDGGTAAAGGYVYRAGGRTGLSKPQVVTQATTTESTEDTTFAMDMPTDRPAGDLYIALICHDDAADTVTAPAGWTEYADVGEHAAYYKIGTDEGGGNEAANYTFTISGSEAKAGTIVRVTGFNPGDPVAGTPGTGTGSGTPQFPATTPDNDATLVIRAIGADNDPISDNSWVPNGHTKIASGNSGGQDCSFGAASLDIPPASGVSTGTADLADNSINDTWGGSSIAINPAGTTPPAQIEDSKTTLSGDGAFTTFTMDMPDTRPAGDLYVALLCHDDTATPGAPGGWTLVPGGDQDEFAAYYKIGTDQGGGNEAATYNWTISPGEEWAGVIVRVTGFDTSDIFSGTPGTTNTSGSPGTFPATTPDTNNTLVIRAIGADNDDPGTGTGWVPAGHTKISSGTSSNTTNDCGFVAASMDNPPAAGVSTGTVNMGNSWLNDTYGGITMAINSAPSSGSSESVRASVNWAKFNSSTLAIESPNPGTGACSGWCNDPTYDLPSARRGHSMVAYNGYLYVIGGVGSDGNRVSTIYIAKLGANGEPQLWHPTNPDKSSWGYWYTGSGAAMNGGTAKSYFGAVAYNNRMYILGGQTNASPDGITTVEMADILPNGLFGSWSTSGMQALPSGAGRHMHTVQVYNDTLYAIGGFEGAQTSSANLRNAVYYSRLNSDGTMNAWQSTNGFTTGRASFGGSFSAIWGAYIYMGGGCSAVNGSGHCTTIGSDMQLASINADGSLGKWGSLGNLDNTRIGYTFIGWQGGLYRLGGCTAQDSSSGICSSTLADVDYGVIKPAGEVSTVNISSPYSPSSDPCDDTSPHTCDLPTVGDDAGEIGHMLNMSVILNGYLYVIGGCTEYDCNTGTNQPSTDDISSNTAYAAISSDGTLVAPPTCSGTSYGAWCVDNTNLINGTDGVAAAGVTIFNGRIYVIGGIDSTGSTTGEIYYVSVNPTDGSLAGAWTAQPLNGTGGIGIAEDIFYTFAYARANPSQASTYPGNLFVFGGCGNGGSGAGCGASDYETEVYKCWIQADGAIETTADSTTFDCTTSGQLQIDSTPGSGGTDGLGIHSGTVYANYIFLIGGFSQAEPDKDDVLYAKFDDNNNVVPVPAGPIEECPLNPASGTTWVESCNKLSIGRRRGFSFGYNGHIYSVGGYEQGGEFEIVPFIEWSKMNVSDGSIGDFFTSSVTINQRWGLSMAVSNSYAYVIGGCDVGASPSDCTSFEPAVQTFQLYNNDSGSPAGYATDDLFATDRLGASAAILNGYVYVAGGCTAITSGVCTTATDNVQYASLDAYGNIGTWANTSDPTLPGARAFGQLEAVGNTLYYMGGQGSTATDERAEVYYGTPSSGNVSSWATASNGLPAARTQHSAAVWNNRIYVTGGLDGSGGPTNTIYRSPVLTGGDISSAWVSTSMPAFDVARSGHTTVAYANNLYVFGGHDGTNYLSDSQFTQINSDGTLDDWTFTTSLPTPLSQADGFAVNGYVYLIGGRSGDATCNPRTLVSPVSANTTILTGNNPTGIGEWYETNARYDGHRYGAAAAYDNGKAYLLGGGCHNIASPVVESITATDTGTGFATDSTNHNVQMPAAVEAGDLLLLLFSNDRDGEGATITDPDGAGGWTAQSTLDSGASGVRGSVWAKVATGSEDGTTVNFVTSSSQSAAAQVYRILAANWYGDLTNGLAVTAGSAATTANPDPPSLDPANWGTENSLWIAYAAGGTYTSITNSPTNYTNGTHHAGNSGADGASVSSARRALSAASDNPGTFTMNASQTSVAFTIAVRPGTALSAADRVARTTLLSQPQVAKYSRLIDTDTDVFPNTWLLNGLDNSIGARWQVRYRSMNDTDGVATDCGSADMTTWGQETNFGDVTLARVEPYVALDGSGNDIGCARYFYFFINIDASRTFGYPEDVSRGPTITDLSLFFTSDPNKRLRHGKTYTGGELQPLDTPCRRGSSAPGDPNYNCPLP